MLDANYAVNCEMLILEMLSLHTLGESGARVAFWHAFKNPKFPKNFLCSFKIYAHTLRHFKANKLLKFMNRNTRMLGNIFQFFFNIQISQNKKK